MLERATACLKSGAARESLKPVQRIPRSKRMLHSTFWSHGAGDLDLPPWAASMFPFPSDLPLKHDSNAREPLKRTRKSRQTEYLRSHTTPLESGFLDFLYPPQALAWLQRANAQQWQRWEKRNAWRLPEGFIVASRGYASRSQVQDAAMPSGSREESLSEDVLDTEYTESYNDWPTVGHERHPKAKRDSRSSPYQAAEHAGRPRSESGGSGQYTVYDPHWRPASSSDSMYAYSPSDLAERVPSADEEDAGSHGYYGRSRADAMQRLRQIMTSSRSGNAKNHQDLSERAISIYDSLEEERRSDTRLKRELIEWLSSQKNEVAQSRCIELYNSITPDERTLQVYQAALAVFLDRKQFFMASKLHEEALNTIENGYQISRRLFTHAVEQQYWQAAMQAERTLFEKFANTKRAGQIQVFWLHVSELSKLLERAIQLVKYVQRKQEGRPLDGHVHGFVARFVKEGLSQEFIRKDDISSIRGVNRDAMPRHQIRRLAHFISQLEQPSTSFFKDLLSEMLSSDARFDYAQLHEVVSYVYRKYRQMPDTRPSENLLMTWLERLTEYSDKLAKLRHTSHSVSIADLIREWQKHYDRVSEDGVKHLLHFYAKAGKLKPYDWWLQYLRAVHPNYEAHKDILWTMIWIHARRADLDAAQHAFAEVKRTTAEHGDEPDVICWNSLLHAHSRADDLEGGLTNLQNMISSGKVQPDKQSFHNITQMLAKRGDVGGVEELLRQYDQIVKQRRETAHLGSIILAHINNEDVQTAETTLREAIPQVRNGVIRGSLVGCFNILMTAYAMRRDIDSTMRTYRWMKNEGVKLDGNSYAAVMQALVFYRRTHEAYGILKKIMPEHNIEPTAFHYAILMAGFVNNRQAKNAISVYEKMTRSNIKPTASTRVAYLKAKAITERQRIGRRKQPVSEPIALEDTMKELKKHLRTSDGSEVTSKQPGHGYDAATMGNADAAPAAYFDFLIFVHGQRRCFEAVKELLQQYRDHANMHGRDSDMVPLRLLSSFAAAAWRHGEYDQVEECWKLAKEQADNIAQLLTVPQLTSYGENNVPMTKVSENQSSVYEAGVETRSDVAAVTEREHSMVHSESKVTPLPDKSGRVTPPVPGRRHILTRVLRYYLLSLHSQGRTADAIATVTKVINQGYTMDNKTWNTFIESLCRKSPPLALLAYVLTERFLTPHFPGWSPTVEYPPRREAVSEGLQYIKARYLAPGQLMPQYRTLVWLGGALLKLQNPLVQGAGSAQQAIEPGLQRYVGTAALIRRHAPKTLFIVQSMPKIPDKLQAQLLDREAS